MTLRTQIKEFGYLISKIIGHVLLFIIGWKAPEPDSLTNLGSHKRMVCVFSHSAYCDIAILFIYLLLSPQYLNKVCTLVMPQAFDYCGSLLTYFNCIPAPKLEARGTKGVNSIIEALESREEFLFLISPKGTVQKAPWRSGYFQIAQQMKIPIAVAGLDYQDKVVRLFSAQSFTDQTTAENQLKDSLGTIVPLYPEREYYSYKRRTRPNLQAINWTRFLLFLSCLGIYFYGLCC